MMYLTVHIHSVIHRLQLDNASDNKSRWILGFFGWMLLKGWVKEIFLSMMMPGP